MIQNTIDILNKEISKQTKKVIHLNIIYLYKQSCYVEIVDEKDNVLGEVSLMMDEDNYKSDPMICGALYSHYNDYITIVSKGK